MEAPGCWGLLLALGLLRGAAAIAATEAPPAHVLSRVLFCQPDRPSQGLADTFDGDQLFSFDFPGARWEPRLPDFQPWVGAQESTEQIRNNSRLCQHLLLALTNMTEGLLPEAKGTPMANVFTARPLELGKPNTLICQVGNLFPASVTVSWQRLGKPVSQGINTTRYYPTEDLGFLLFSYLEFTPQEGDVYTCTITRPRDRFTTVAYWVPQNPIPSELLENVLCGVAIALGIFFLVTGIVLLLKSRRPSPTE
ncbi:class II histocompatibility antigen, M alpha chain [Dermochelys coriacea]|uniref:class II histocompatibility antigen, M alpha chain n=1 Tax=Dermochelys coriacea TaxID=27794 RepID=UPI0018E7F01C|nr:class II histocompatibility antigen, M alpha chain [Dermochelys coriacea]